MISSVGPNVLRMHCRFSVLKAASLSAAKKSNDLSLSGAVVCMQPAHLRDQPGCSISQPARKISMLGRRVDLPPIRFSPVLDEALPREDQRTFRRNGTVSTIRKRARINML